MTQTEVEALARDLVSDIRSAREALSGPVPVVGVYNDGTIAYDEDYVEEQRQRCAALKDLAEATLCVVRVATDVPRGGYP